MYRRNIYIYFLILVFTLTAGALAHGAPAPSASLLEDAAAYAGRFGVGTDEALRRLQLQQEIGDLDADLAVAERAAFAGLWIEHSPTFRVVVRFTDPEAAGRLRARLGRGPLADLVETRSAKWSLAELEKRQHEARGLSHRANVSFNSDINVAENQVELYVKNPEKLNAARLPEGVAVKRVIRLAYLEALVGGSSLNACTGGFTVQATTGELGISTAAHCPDQQYFQGLNLPFRYADENGDQDVQWNSSCDIVQTTNQFETGIGLRSCIGTRHRNNQAIGSVVWKFGRTTGRTFGTISSKSFDIGPNHNATFIRVDSCVGGVCGNLSEGGDSGGPWFVEDIAYGSHVGAPGDDDRDSIYMAINYISSIGVSVLTSNPGACNFPPTASFTAAPRLNGTTYFDASASRDPDGTIVRYEWNFDDGTTAVTTIPTITHNYPPDSGSYYVVLWVTDNEGKRASAFREVLVCSPLGCDGGPTP